MPNNVQRWAWHPFSVSSAPTANGAGSPFTVHVRDMSTARVKSSDAPLRNTWSHSLWSVAGTPDELTRAGGVRMYGPFGRLSLPVLDGTRTPYPVVVLIAGGIGATPLISVLADIHRRHASGVEFVGLRAVHLIWVCTTPAPFYHWFDIFSTIEKVKHTHPPRATQTPKRVRT